jgi:hypothetical protein
MDRRNFSKMMRELWIVWQGVYVQCDDEVPLRCQEELNTQEFLGLISSENGYHAVPIHWSWSVLLQTSRTARLKCAGAPSRMRHIRALTTEQFWKIICRPTKQSPTIPVHTLMLNRCWCLHGVPPAITHKLNVSWHILIWIFFSWNSCPKFVRTFKLHPVYKPMYIPIWHMYRTIFQVSKHQKFELYIYISWTMAILKK